ncbi:hypothetical protein F4805DRAFT_462015 [Annulohypoxylon moriforme]|nr:hypothetical protein F4805DRAFT_462015 [Annulohypoxylon moriforme]
MGPFTSTDKFIICFLAIQVIVIIHFVHGNAGYFDEYVLGSSCTNLISNGTLPLNISSFSLPSIFSWANLSQQTVPGVNPLANLTDNPLPIPVVGEPVFHPDLLLLPLPLLDPPAREPVSVGGLVTEPVVLVGEPVPVHINPGERERRMNRKRRRVGRK